MRLVFVGNAAHGVDEQGRVAWGKVAQPLEGADRFPVGEAIAESFGDARGILQGTLVVGVQAKTTGRGRRQMRAETLLHTRDDVRRELRKGPPTLGKVVEVGRGGRGIIA